MMQHMDDPYTKFVDGILGTNCTLSGSMLHVGQVAIDELAHKFGTPFYVYNASLIRNKVQDLSRALPGIECYYSVKANPNPSIIKLLLESGCGMEIASEGEMELVLASGCPPERVVFAGPGKTDRELGKAVELGIGEVHIESLHEAARLSTEAIRRGRKVDVSVRINPASLTQGAAQQMGGRPTAFGIDEEDLDVAVRAIEALEGLHLSGLHVFTGTQNLNAAAFEDLYTRIVEMARRIVLLLGRPLTTVDFGGGFGVPYFPGENALDLNVLREAVSRVMEPLREDPCFNGTRFMVEPGRFLTAESGIYVARVTTLKQSRGTRFAVLDGGLNHHLPASGQFGQVVKRNFPITIARQLPDRVLEKYELVGPLCTPLDVVGRGILLPTLEVGDLVLILQSGAYARTTSPLGFLSHYEPKELMIDDCRAEVIRGGGSFQQLVRGTCLDASRPTTDGAAPFVSDCQAVVPRA